MLIRFPRNAKPETPEISVAQARALLEQIKSGEVEPCSHCKGIHARACPRVKRMIFNGGEIREIEFWADWPQSGIIWPEELQEVVDNEETEEE